MFKLRPFLLILSGVLIFAAGLGYDVIDAGLPYQDPTPEMQAEWLRQKMIAERIRLCGVLSLAAGCLWGVAKWILLRINSIRDR